MRTPLSKSRTAVAALALASLALSGCGRSSDAQAGPGAGSAVDDGKASGTIDVWAMGTEGEKLQAFVKTFEQANPDAHVKVTAIPWEAAHDKIASAISSGKTPDVSLVGTTWMGEFAQAGGLDPTPKDLVSQSDFYSGAWGSTVVGNTSYGVPWYVETRVLYYRTDLAKKAGWDKAPQSWAELKDYATRLTKKDAGGKVTQWGVQIPSSGFPYWLFQVLTTTNDAILANDAGNAVRFDDPKVVEALQYWVDLSKAGVHPPGVVEWGTTPKDFFERKAAIIFTTTGNLTNVKNNAKFDFGVGMIPGNKRKGSPTGGGNFYIFKKATPQQQEAAFTFIKWITQPERAALWSMETGYVGVSEAAYKTDSLAKYGRDFPQALVARDQLPYSVAEFSTHDNQRVTKALNDGLQAALTGAKTPAQAMKDAQAEADRILRSYK